MKTYLIWLLLLIPIISISQSDLDVLRYSQTGVNGDARFLAMGGSFAALGANSSCMNYNPAGIGLFRVGEISINLGVRVANSNTTHYGSTTNDFKFNPIIGYFGLCRSIDGKNPYTSETAKKKFPDYNRRHTIGFSVNKVANFNYNTTIEGYVKDKTIVEDFLNYAQGFTPENLNYFYEGMAFNTYLIDTFPGTLSEYGTYYYLNGKYKQKKEISSQGGINEMSFAYAYSIDNKYYLGASIGVPMVRYDYNSIYTESDSANTVENFKKLTYEELVQTRGTGVNLKLGAIARVNPYMRIGAYVHTPTIIRLNDAYESFLQVNYDTLFGYANLTLRDSSGQGEFSYSVTTPMRAGAAIGLLVNKILALNLEYEFINYSQGYLNSKPNYFQEVNKEIRNKYTSTGNIRIGSEINLNPFAIRLGFASYGSPFGNLINAKFVRNSFSLGGGFKSNAKWYADLAIVHSRYKEDYYLYKPELIEKSEILQKQTQVIGTLGLRF